MNKATREKTSLETLFETFDGLEESEETIRQEQDRLFQKYGCTRFLVVPKALYEHTKRDSRIKKRDIEKDSMSAYILTIEGTQWVRLYKLKLLKKEGRR